MTVRIIIAKKLKADAIGMVRKPNQILVIVAQEIPETQGASFSGIIFAWSKV